MVKIINPSRDQLYSIRFKHLSTVNKYIFNLSVCLCPMNTITAEPIEKVYGSLNKNSNSNFRMR